MGNTLINVGHEQVLVDRKLGQGGFSQVYLVHSQISNREYAMKVMYYGDQNDLKRIQQEINVHKALCKNEFIVPLIDSAIYSEPEKKVVLLMDYCPVSTINVLERTYPNPIKEEAVLRMFYQICHAVAFMHSQNPPLFHRDLKVENVLFKNKKFLLTDFGSVVPESKFYNRTKGDCPIIDENIQKYTTLAYRSPEMINLYDYKPIGRKADVWALGCILYKICYFDTPFEESPMRIQFCKYSIPNNYYSKKVTQFFEKIFVIDPFERINTFQLMDMIAKEVNLPNPYANLMDQSDPVASSAPSPSPNPVQPQEETLKPQVSTSSSAGLFWDNFKDIPTQSDDSLKQKPSILQPKTSGESQTSSSITHSTNSVNNSSSNISPSLNKSTDLFSFDEYPKKSYTPMTTSTDLFSFNQPSNTTVSQSPKPSSSASLFDFGTPSTKQTTIVMTSNSSNTHSPQPKSQALFDFESESPFNSNSQKKDDIFASLNTSKSKSSSPNIQQTNGDLFWKGTKDSFDFNGQW
ncbi:actin-regulating kinase, putative [Entamoeba histolytica KU27]|uniref:non-specific serine/threonine protein kinase n=1 Tax=Entamoeba histolytica KU27 TaxID=885311 RepID=M2RJR5_ENTHI|nr:actin-regulating kinase, putative [Entamoeba histolytica KU27]